MCSRLLLKPMATLETSLEANYDRRTDRQTKRLIGAKDILLKFPTRCVKLALAVSPLVHGPYSYVTYRDKSRSLTYSPCLLSPMLKISETDAAEALYDGSQSVSSQVPCSS